MIEKIVLNLVSQMESKKMIDKSDSEHYEYGSCDKHQMYFSRFRTNCPKIDVSKF